MAFYGVVVPVVGFAVEVTGLAIVEDLYVGFLVTFFAVVVVIVVVI